MVMALNFWHSGGSFEVLQKIQRGLNPQYLRLVRHLKALLKSEDPTVSFPLCKAGRRFPELTARISELFDYMTRHGIGSDTYTKTFQGVQEELKPDKSVMPELEPYLDESRLLIVDEGKSDITEFLDDSLVMAYREPKLLDFGASPYDCAVIRDQPSKILSLAKVWDK